MLESNLDRRDFLKLSSLAAVVAYLGRSFIWYGLEQGMDRNRPERVDKEKVIAPGVKYYRRVEEEPRPLVLHILGIHLNSPHLELIVAVDDSRPDSEAVARSASELYRMHNDGGLLALINGGFGEPAPYPDSGRPIDPLGHLVSYGVEHSPYEADYPVFYATRENGFYRPVISEKAAPEDAEIAIAGNTILVKSGDIQVEAGGSVHPRTLLGFSQGVLWWLVVDGRQAGYSEGLSLYESALYMVEVLGVLDAINLDGGGSSVMVIDGKIANSPINGLLFRNQFIKAPMKERAVPYAVGIAGRSIRH